MKIVAVVPVKLNSRRLNQKNIKCFTNGKPLCHYILETLLKVNLIDEVFVYCSDERIREYIPKQITFLKRSEDLDQDSTKINEVLGQFALDVEADVYVMAHVTAPFVRKESIIKGINSVINEGYDSSFAAKRKQDFWWKDGRPFNYQLDNIPRTQDLPIYYEETSGFYIYKNEVMTQQKRRIGNHPFIVEVGEIESIDIDEMEDFVLADAIYNFFRNEEDVLWSSLK